MKTRRIFYVFEPFESPPFIFPLHKPIGKVHQSIGDIGA
jgi:hypothetical protein